MKSITKCLVAPILLLTLPCFQANIAGPISNSTWSRKISLSLQSELARNPTADIIVSTKVGTSGVIKKFKSENPMRSGKKFRRDRLKNLVSRLERSAEESQKGCVNFLNKNKKRNSVTVKSLWISNQVVVKNADKEMISNLAELEDVRRIDLNEIIKLTQPMQSNISVSRAWAELSWGIQDIGAPEVWKETTGEGVIVATIDTGVRASHESLKNNYIGDYGWYDPYKQTSEPNDQNGHGTHATGTIVGQGGIGVAPSAKWMSCKGCDTDSCTTIALLECGQFITCPTLPNGTIPDCSKAPDIVSNSWGGGQGLIFYDDIIAAWHSVGIIPVFANGNEGSECGTTSSPADSITDVIAVGATTYENNVAWFSSRGPTVFGTIKPDVSAPGTNILSAHHVDDYSYIAKDGTSMACPHVAGVIALLKSVYPDITYAEVKSALFNGANTKLEIEGGNCGGVSSTKFPNNFYGYGKVNAVNTMKRPAIRPANSIGSSLQFYKTPLCGNLLLILTAAVSSI